MKKFILITILSLICVASSAQFMNYSTSEFSRKSAAAPSNHFGSIWFSYHPITLTFQEPGYSDKETLHGISAFWTNANELGNISLFVEYGLGVQYAFNNERGGGTGETITWSTTNNLVSLRAPLRLLYKFDIPGTSISISPFTGFDFIVHLLWSQKQKVGTSVSTSDFFEYAKNELGEGLNRFNMDWHFGARVMFGHFFLSAGYEVPLVGLYSKNSAKIHFSQANLSLGFTF